MPSELQVSPSVEQLPARPWHVPLLHSLLQQPTLEVQVPPAPVHTDAVEQVSEVGSQKSEQHWLDSAHVAPAALHSLGPLHRMTPSTSASQCPSQHCEPDVQVSPVSSHEEAGTSHRPFTQLSEQQSVFSVQVFA